MTDAADELTPPPQLTARTDEDLVALAPVLLGFWPEQDIVMLTFGGSRTFHARIDLPPASLQSSESLAGITASLLVPAVQHDVQAVVFVCHTEQPDDLTLLWPSLLRATASAGIAVVRALVIDGRWMRRLDESGARRVEYDVTAHPFVVQALVEGRLRYPSRAAMVESLEPDPEAVDGVEAELARLDAEEREGWDEWTSSDWEAEEMIAEGIVDEAVARWLDEARRPNDREVALLLRLLRPGPSPVVAAAGDERRFWSALLPRTPEQYVPFVATALADAAWRTGDGAMAWAALDRALGVRPRHRPALALADLLERAVPPEAG
ncbi:DUF4192 domain-containing protein [Nocardioides sp. BGMRC 2183]|nr:DUF4192 domain-containing protein [Nocardioides sp. BGMRC 2183]